MTVRASAADAKFAFEVTKLLLQAVWADGEVEDEEAAAVHDFAVRSGVELADVEALDGWLGGESPLPLPNLGLLREKRTEVLRAVRKLITSDQRIHDEEEAILGQISELLG
jgi:uncharacterized tellurite resistance protein B-like protein